MLSRRLTTFWYSILFICFYDYINLSWSTTCCCLSGDIFRNFINHSVFTDIWTQSNISPIYNYPANIRLDEEMKKMKRSWKRLSSESSEDILKTSSRRLHQDKYVRLILTSSEDVFKTSWSRPIYSSWSYVFKTSSRRFQDVFKTPSRRLAKTSLRHLRDVLPRRLFKPSSGRLAKTSSRNRF